MRRGISIRAAVAEDVDDVVALERAVPEAPHWSESAYRAIVEDGRSGVKRCLMVALDDGALVGFAVGKVVAAARLAELESVVVAAPARRLGAGRALCEAVIEWCRRQGATSMELEVRAASNGARALYEELGFAVEGIRQGYYRDPEEDAVLMRLNLEGCG